MLLATRRINLSGGGGVGGNVGFLNMLLLFKLGEADSTGFFTTSRQLFSASSSFFDNVDPS